MLLLVRLIADLPAKAPEMTRTTYRNRENVRNVMVQDGSMLILTVYHKMQHMVGQRPVCCFLAPPVGDLLATFITMVLPFARFLQTRVLSNNVGVPLLLGRAVPLVQSTAVGVARSGVADDT